MALASKAWALPAGVAGLSFDDEFNGNTLNLNNWNYRSLGTRNSAVNIQNAVAVANGDLTITTYTSGGTNYTGMIGTQNLFQQAYGYFEARINFADSPGGWSAFWVQSPTNGTPVDNPQVAGSEMDIVEHRNVNSSNGNISNQVDSALHWDGYGTAEQDSSLYTTIPTLTANSWHTYGMLWTTTALTFYYDGAVAWTQTNPIAAASEYMILSSEVHDANWAGTVPTAGYGSINTSTTKMTVDYVHGYTLANVYSPTPATTDAWSNGTHWNYIPISGSSTELTMVDATGATAVASGLTNTNTNSAAALFQANIVDLGGAGAALGTAATIAMNSSGPGLSLVTDSLSGATPVINLIAKQGTAGLNYSINSPITLTTNTTFQGNGSAGFNFFGIISGPGQLTKTGTSTITLGGSNTYTGLTNVSGGVVNVTGDMTAANGGWVLDPTNVSTSAVNFSSGSLIAVAAANGIQIGGLAANNTSSQTINAAGLITNSGSLAVSRVGNLNVNSGGVWNQAGNVSVNSFGGYSSSLTVNTGGSFNYSSSTPISLNASNGAFATLNISGGIFITGQPFAEINSTGNTSYGSLVLANGGALTLSANVLQLISAPSVVPLQIGTGGGIFNTITFSTAINSSISNVAGQAGLLTKVGNGVLTLSGSNSYSGGTNISSGAILATNSASLGTGTVAIIITGASTASLQLSGGITVSNPFVGFGSETAGNTPTIENISGNNILTAPLSITGTGGNGAIFQSDAGTLNLSGGMTTTLPSSRVYYFQGAGNGIVAGNITDDASNILRVEKDGTGTWTFSGTNDTYSVATNVSAGTLIFASPGALPLFSKLSITGGAGVAANHGTAAKNSLFVSILTVNGIGTLDLTNNDMAVRNSSIGTVTSLVKSGFNFGNWQGNTGILSSIAAADTSHLTALGVIQNSIDGTANGTPLVGSFDSQSVKNSDVLVKYTYYGDVNFDGIVDGSDYSRIDAAYVADKAHPGISTGWYNGDFNYDGLVDGSDYTLIDNAFNSQSVIYSTSVADPTAEIAAKVGDTSSVPEPAGFVLAAGGSVLLGRRQRRFKN